MAEFDYKSLLGEIRSLARIEFDYAKLTAVEKLSVLLSAVGVALVLLIIGACMLFNLSSALVAWLNELTACLWASYLIVAALLLVVLLIVLKCRKGLIVDPITRFVTKLFIKPNDEQQ